ncbi:MAG: outer membrane protein assembly factor BamA [Desulfobacteraceae bacterium]|nr:MAG: outer membrane protein assembly factor BamA [Desulfobacteraceae bacterium]
MDKFNKKNLTKGSRSPFLLRPFFVLKALFCFMGITLLLSNSVRAEESVKVAVLPFQINTAQNLNHLREGLQTQFQDRLAGLGFKMIDLQALKKHPLIGKASKDPAAAAALGKELGADFIISGSLTQVGKKISLDVKAVDVDGIRPPVVIFIVEENMDQLKEAVVKAAKDIHNGISGLERIDSIKIKGNKRVEAEAILVVIGSKPGEVLDNDSLDKDLRAIYTMGFFKDVNIETENGPQGKVVIFNVIEKPSIGSINFRGNKKIKTDDLRKETGIKLYAILNQAEIKQAGNRLRDFYRQKGFYSAQISEIVEEGSNNEVTLIFEIAEESKVYIKEIDFTGNEHFKDRALRDVMQNKEKGFLSFLTQKGLLDKKQLETDAQRLVVFYHNHGYIKVKIGEPQVAYDEKEKGLKILIDIVEGPQYLINEVKIEGDLILPLADLLEKINIKKGKPYNREIIRNDILDLTEVYGDQGYAYVDVLPDTAEDDEKKQVNITYRIAQGEKVRLERIYIAGNDITRDKVIRRELKLNEGDYFSGTALRKSRLNLYRLDYFEEVEVDTKKGSSDDSMILDVKVKEKSTRYIYFGGGYSSYEKAMGKVMIEDKNLFGKGQDLSASVQLSSRSSQYDIKFTEPWLFDKKLSAGIDLYKLKEEEDNYTKDGWGGALRFGFPIEAIDENTWGSIRYGYDNSDLWEDVVSGTSGFHNYVTSSITLGLSRSIRDDKDNPFFPRHGSTNVITYEYAGGLLGGDVAYDKWSLKSAWFFPMPLETAFAVQGRWGLVQKGADGVLPSFQKFRLGGIDSIRGFKTRSISPIDPVLNKKVGGEKMMVYNLEYRFHVYKRQGVTGVVFFDAGNVYTENENYSFSNLKKSYGAGIRWRTPLFPIRLEYGKVISPTGDEKKGGWEFMLGYPF